MKKPIELTTAMLEALYGDAHLSLEGSLSHLNLHDFTNASTQPTSVLKRQTLQPEQDFIVLPVELNSKDTIIRTILPRIGIRTSIIHVQIEKNGKLEFAAYDQFHPDCVWVSDKIDEAILKSLVDTKIIRSYTKVED